MIPGSPQPLHPQALGLKLIDRSRRETGLAKCARDRWLTTAFTNGYGIRRRVEALPLATGATIHEAFKPILEYAMQQSRPVTPDEIIDLTFRDGVWDRFWEKGNKKLIDLGVTDPTLHLLSLNEQLALGKGLVYAWSTQMLPWVMSQQRIIQVEQEEIAVVGCTCGLGDQFGTAEQHDQRNCAGFGYQCRGDFFTMPLSGDSIVYHDFKSTGWLNEGWREGWRYKIQVAASGIAAERRIGRPVTHVVIHGLYKGKRQRDYNPDTGKYDLGPWKQNSDLTYMHYKAANPPMWEDQWSYAKPTGKGARTDWGKRGSWEYPGGTWKFLKDMPPELLQAQCLIAGPFEVNRHLLGNYLESLVTDERRWQSVEQQLYDCLVKDAGGDWSTPKFQSKLNELVPQSWDCYRFGKPCDKLGICHRHAGWEDPLSNGYQLRRPHHEPELIQMQSRGLMPPEDEEVTENDDE
jgi:hypothetical protein